MVNRKLTSLHSSRSYLIENQIKSLKTLLGQPFSKVKFHLITFNIMVFGEDLF